MDAAILSLSVGINLLALVAIHTALLGLKQRRLVAAHRAQIRLILTAWLIFFFSPYFSTACSPCPC